MTEVIDGERDESTAVDYIYPFSFYVYNNKPLVRNPGFIIAVKLAMSLYRCDEWGRVSVGSRGCSRSFRFVLIEHFLVNLHRIFFA